MKHFACLLLLASCAATPQPPLATGIIDAIHGPYHGCLKWYIGDPSSAWRASDPQRWDTASADEYTPGEAIEVYWVCDMDPKHLAYDVDGDGDVDMRDVAIIWR
jgi:hypothetical protein